MSIPLTSHPQASLDSPPPLVFFVPPTVVASASVKWVAQPAGCVGSWHRGYMGTYIFKSGLAKPCSQLRQGLGVVSGPH